MSLLQTLVTAISLLLPATGAVATRSVGLDSSVSAWTCVLDSPCGLIQRRNDLPTPSRLFIESLDETALGEEETDEIDNSAITSQVVFGENTFPSLLLDPSSPRRLHALTTAVRSILRC